MLVAWAPASQAQLAGHNTRGDYGLLSGTQTPVGIYGVGMVYDYTADTLRDKAVTHSRPFAERSSLTHPGNQ